MLTIVVSVAILSTGPTGAPPPNWLHDLLASPRAKNVAAYHAPKKSGGGKPAGAAQGGASGASAGPLTYSNSTTIHDPEDDARLKAANAAGHEAGILMNQGRYEDAYASITAFRLGRPDAASVMDDFTADCANLTGRYGEVYDLLVPTLRMEDRGAIIGPSVKLEMSFASARLGQVYDGQVEFCRYHVNLGLSQQHVSEPLDHALMRRTDPKTVALLSCLALGLEFGKAPYLELALSLDPTNVIAARGLISYYTARGRIADLHRMAAGMLKILPAGDPRRAPFERSLAWEN